VSIRCGSSQRCVYLVIPMKNNIIIIEDFNIHKDIIDLVQFPWLKGIEDLSFSTNPQVLFLGSSQLIFFRQHEIIQFSSKNFYFVAKTKNPKTRDKSDDLVFQFAMIGLIAIFFIVIGIVVDNMHRQDKAKQDDSDEWKEGKDEKEKEDELEMLEKGERDKQASGREDEGHEDDEEDYELSSMSDDLITNQKIESQEQIENEDKESNSVGLSSFSSFLSDNQEEQENDFDLETLSDSSGHWKGDDTL
jgi:hypothetical protein